MYTYLFNAPVLQERIELQNNGSHKVPKTGDLLLSIKVDGRFDEAIMFQYDWTGSRKVVYASLTQPGVMNPFPASGFPLIQCGKALYIEVSNPGNNINIVATYAFLEDVSRKRLGEYIQPNTRDGVKFVHENGDIYQAINVLDCGNSSHYVALVHFKK